MKRVRRSDARHPFSRSGPTPRAVPGPGARGPRRSGSRPATLRRLGLAALVLIALLPAACRAPEDWAALKAAIAVRYPTVETVTTDELAAWLARPDTVAPVLLDRRAPEEYAVSHLRGALLVPDLDTALKRLAQAPLDTPIVVYCSVGYRSAALARDLQEAGYCRVRNLEGSLFQWANEGRPLYRDHQPVDTVHPYGSPWSRFLAPERRADVP